MRSTKIDVKRIAVIGVLCALAYLCTFLLHFKVMFLTFDFKDAIIAVSGLMYGPLAGLFSAFIVALTEFVTFSNTGVYGLIMNFLSSAAFSVVGGFIYKYRRTFSGAIFSGIASVFSVVAVMMLANLFITPLFLHRPREAIIDLMPTVLLPFNLIKSVINASLTLLIYKPVTKAFGRLGLTERKQQKAGSGLRTVILTLCCLVVAAVSVLIFIFVLNGSVEF